MPRTTHRADAKRPRGKGGREYHLDTKPGDIAERCILVGDPERATLIAEGHLQDAVKVGDKRGLLTYTGRYMDVPMSVTTTGMGGPTVGIVLPEAVRSGARAFMHVGTCGALQRDIRVGSIVICSAAVRLDGASDDWAPHGYPAVADWKMVARLETMARRLGIAYRTGIGATTASFVEGQARPDDSKYIPQRMLERHEELIRRGVLFYAMEDAAFFTWCSTHGSIPAGSVNAVFANRISNKFKAVGIDDAVHVACLALARVRF